MSKATTFSLQTKSRLELVNITEEIRRAVAASGVRDGICTVFVPHTTAGVTVNEGADPDVTADIIDALERAVPSAGSYRHMEGNAAAHVKASLVGSFAQMLVAGGSLSLGTWQAVFFCEFDGPRSRKVTVSVS